MWRLLAIALLAWWCWPGQSAAAERPDKAATDVGAYDVSAGTTWTALTSASFTCAATGTACRPNQLFSTLVIVNTHATGTLYVQLRTAGVVDSTANRIPVYAGGSLTLPVWGVNTRAISIIGSTAGVTGSIIALLFPY